MGNADNRASFAQPMCQECTSFVGGIGIAVVYVEGGVRFLSKTFAKRCSSSCTYLGGECWCIDQADD